MKKLATIAFLSDTHNKHKKIEKLFGIPKCDVIFHLGDFTMEGSEKESVSFLKWYSGLPIENKVFIAGNHDVFFDPSCTKHGRLKNMNRIQTVNPRDIVPDNVIYLENESIVINGIKVYGSPYQPEFHNWAFNLKNPKALEACWGQIPNDVEILLTHTPPLGHLDVINRGVSVGCTELKVRIIVLDKLKIHAFGHIHEGMGIDISGGITYINASNVTSFYNPIYKPMVFDFFEDGSSVQVKKWEKI